MPLTFTLVSASVRVTNGRTSKMLWRRVDCYGLHGTTRLRQNGLIARAATAANGSAAAVEQAQLDAVPLEYFRLKPRLDQQ